MKIKQWYMRNNEKLFGINYTKKISKIRCKIYNFEVLDIVKEANKNCMILYVCQLYLLCVQK